MSGPTQQTEHGEAGHLNVYRRDQDSVVTGRGRHYRVVAFLPDAQGELLCRVDHKHGPRMPTSEEILVVARNDQGVRGRFVLARAEQAHESTYFFFRREAPR
jgi:hypothetical protein